MSTLGKRLKRLRNSKRWTLVEVSEKLGLRGHSTYSNWEYDRAQPDAEMLAKLAQLFGVTSDFLIGKDENNKTLPEDYGLVPVNFDKMVKLPILGTIRAGEPIDMLENIEGYELVEPELLRGREGFVLKVTGNSMSGDYIFNGYKVLVVMDQDISPNDIAVVSVNGYEATLKRIKCQGGVCVLTSSNPEFEPMIYPAEQINVIGKVVRFWKDI